MKHETPIARQAVALEVSDLLDLSWTPYRWVPLSATDPSVRCLVDLVDYEWLSVFVWNVWHDGRDHFRQYAKRNTGTRRDTVRMAREIMIEAEPLDDAVLRLRFADHINGQTLDNRRANLRWATKAENQMNRRARGTVPSLDSIVAGLIAGLEPPLPMSEVPF